MNKLSEVKRRSNKKWDDKNEERKTYQDVYNQALHC